MRINKHLIESVAKSVSIITSSQKNLTVRNATHHDEKIERCGIKT